MPPAIFTARPTAEARSAAHLGTARCSRLHLEEGLAMRNRMFSIGAIAMLTLAVAGSGTLASAQKENILHNFPVANGVDGYAPTGAVTFDANGGLWGTTTMGGAYGGGTV